MSEKEFIIDFLKGLVKSYPEVHIRYALEASTEYHIVTIQPTEMLRSNKGFRKEVCKLWEAFEEAFPDSDILITEPKESFDMSNILYDSEEDRLETILENIDTIVTSEFKKKEYITYEKSEELWSGFDFVSAGEYIVEQDYALAA